MSFVHFQVHILYIYVCIIRKCVYLLFNLKKVFEEKFKKINRLKICQLNDILTHILVVIKVKNNESLHFTSFCRYCILRWIKFVHTYVHLYCLIFNITKKVGRPNYILCINLFKSLSSFTFISYLLLLGKRFKIVLAFYIKCNEDVTERKLPYF